MNKEDMVNKIKSFVIKSLKERLPGISEQDIEADNELVETYMMNSIEMVMIIVECEINFDMEFADEDLVYDNVKTINIIADYIISYKE